jgi:hypothetical protein
MPRRRLFKKPDTWEYGHDTPAHERPLERPKKRRAATTAAFAVLFFAGAAFTAVAGDRFAEMTQAEDAAATDPTSTDLSTTDSPQPAEEPTAAATDAPADAAAPAPAPSDETAAPADAAEESAPAADPATLDSSETQDNGIAQLQRSAPDAANTSTSSGAPEPSPQRKTSAARVPLHVVFLPSARPAPKPEIEGPEASATVWLNRALPDPTPPALRLSPAFARHLTSIAKADGADWALMLGVLRAKGATGHVPATKGTLNQLAGRLLTLSRQSKGDWSTALALDGSASFADRAQALARYNRAVGLWALVKGLESAKRAIAQRVLNDPSISIYPGGRDDIANNTVDVRVLALISYLHESFGQVTVSSLVSGHRLYARPGVISAHVYGHAVDIAALGGTPILGHQEPGGLTEHAVRDVLLLPSELMPKQVISLLGLGGPSLPLADHYNHIHIGY